MNFETLGLAQPLLAALADSGYTTPTPVQLQAIPPAMQGQDLKVASATGSGKTAAFVLPALQQLLAARAERRPGPADAAGAAPAQRRAGSGPRVLVLAPTRELAQQVAKAASSYGRHVKGLKIATIVGGVPYGAQLKALRGPLDILIATPGRMLDHFGAGKLSLDNVGLFVLDEADRMLDMGFIDDIRHVAAQLPAQRQTMMFSATFAGAAGRLASEMLKGDARTIATTSHTDTHVNIEQRLHWADNSSHKHAMLEQLLTEPTMEQALIFTSTQRDADWLADQLAQIGHAVAALHGGMPQGRRNRVLTGLRSRQLRVLVATDVAARGIDVPGISHVINYGMPMKAEDYVHRIGRTGRAGRSGLAITLAERRDIGLIKRIQQFTTQQIPVATVVGLEPKMAAPVLNPERRPMGAGGFRSGPPNGSFRNGPAPGGFRNGPPHGGFRAGPPQGGFRPPAQGGFRPGPQGHGAADGGHHGHPGERSFGHDGPRSHDSRPRPAGRNAGGFRPGPRQR